MIAFFNSAARQVDVFSTNPLRNELNAQAELRQLLLIYLNLDFVFESAADLDRSRSVFGFQVILDAVFGQPAQCFQLCFCRLAACEGLFLVKKSEPHNGLGRGIEAQQ